MMNLADLLPWVSAILGLSLTVGSLLALRQGYSKQASDIQEHVISVYKEQNAVQEKQIATCEREIARLKRVVVTIQRALKMRGIVVEIENDVITLVDDHPVRSTRTTVQIQMPDEKGEEKSDAV